MKRIITCMFALYLLNMNVNATNCVNDETTYEEICLMECASDSSDQPSDDDDTEESYVDESDDQTDSDDSKFLDPRKRNQPHPSFIYMSIGDHYIMWNDMLDVCSLQILSVNGTLLYEQNNLCGSSSLVLPVILSGECILKITTSMASYSGRITI